MTYSYFSMEQRLTDAGEQPNNPATLNLRTGYAMGYSTGARTQQPSFSQAQINQLTQQMTNLGLPEVSPQLNQAWSPSQTMGPRARGA